MKLYYNPISPNCRRALATVYENGREGVELVLLDLMKGEHKTPEYLAINPNGKVPALVDGDLNLWESTAIMQYLSSDSPLWPPNASRYDIIRWQCWGLAHWGPAINKIVFERVVKAIVGGGDPDEAVVTQGLADFEKLASVLDEHLNNQDYLVNNTITLADFSVAANLTYAAAASLDLSPYPNILRWYGQIEERDSWQKSAPPQM